VPSAAAGKRKRERERRLELEADIRICFLTCLYGDGLWGVKLAVEKKRKKGERRGKKKTNM